MIGKQQDANGSFQTLRSPVAQVRHHKQQSSMNKTKEWDINDNHFPKLQVRNISIHYFPAVLLFKGQESPKAELARKNISKRDMH